MQSQVSFGDLSAPLHSFVAVNGFGVLDDAGRFFFAACRAA